MRFDIYSIAAHQCSTGDWPGSCLWEKDGLTDKDIKNGAYLPYYSIQMTTVVNCAPPDMPAVPGGGGGGGGATTPTPPSDYDPCPGGAGAIAYANVYGGLKLAVAAGNPCDGGETGLTPIPTNPAAAAIQSLIANLPITDYPQQQYLYNNTNVAVAVYNYLITNGWTPDNKGFASWAIGYLLDNSNIPGFDANNEVKLLTFKEESDLNAPALDWNSYTPPQQKQPMPSFATISASWPYTIEAGTGFYRSYAGYVYNLAGGQLGSKYGTSGYENACAIRGSICLNNSSYTIPQIAGTEKGANDKNFILRAIDFRNYLNNHFEGPKARLNVTSYTTKDQIMNWLKENGGKNGIYIAVNKDIRSKSQGGAGYTGHVDLITNGLVINGYFISPIGGLSYIEIW